MSVVTRKRSANFAIIPNHVADDESLSFEARGVLCYLLAKPNDWKIHRRDIENAGKIGRDKVLRILQELAAAGYLERQELRGENGSFAGYDYTVYDDPMLSSLPFPENQDTVRPRPENPDTAQPEPDLPDTGHPNTENTDAYIRTNSNKNPPKAPQRSDAVEPLWSAWAVEHLPNSRIKAQAMFLALDPAQQAAAIRLAPEHQRRQILRKKPLHLIAYLRDRAWEELDGAPQFDSAGDFVITPKHRAEWSAWLGRIRQKYGEDAVERTVMRKAFVAPTRFPPDEPIGKDAAA